MKADEEIIGYARDAKFMMSESGEALIRDELIMRAAVVYRQLERMDGKMVVAADEHDRRWNRSLVICFIAAGFHDDPPSTPQRAALFAHELGDPVADAMRAVVAGNRRALGLSGDST